MSSRSSEVLTFLQQADVRNLDVTRFASILWKGWASGEGLRHIRSVSYENGQAAPAYVGIDLEWSDPQPDPEATTLGVSMSQMSD